MSHCISYRFLVYEVNDNSYHVYRYFNVCNVVIWYQRNVIIFFLYKSRHGVVSFFQVIDLRWPWLKFNELYDDTSDYQLSYRNFSATQCDYLCMMREVRKSITIWDDDTDHSVDRREGVREDKTIFQHNTNTHSNHVYPKEEGHNLWCWLDYISWNLCYITHVMHKVIDLL